MAPEEVAPSPSLLLNELLDRLATTEARFANAQAKVQRLEALERPPSIMTREGYDFILEERSALEVRMKDLQEHLDQEAENFDVLAAVHEETLDVLGKLKQQKASLQRHLSDAQRGCEAADKKWEEVAREQGEQLVQLQQEFAALSTERDEVVSQVQALEAECESTCWLRQQLAESEDLLCESEAREAELGRKHEQSVQQCNDLQHQLNEGSETEARDAPEAVPEVAPDALGPIHFELSDLQAGDHVELEKQLSETEGLLCQSEAREAEQTQRHEQAVQQCDRLEQQLAESRSRQLALQQQLGELQAKGKSQLCELESCDVEERPRAVSSMVAEFEERAKAVRGGTSLVSDSPTRPAAIEPDAMIAQSEHSMLASPETAMEEQFQHILSQHETEGVQNLFSSALDELVDDRDSAVQGLNEAHQQIVRMELEIEALKLSTSNLHEQDNIAMKQEMQTQMQQEAMTWMTSVQDQAKAALAQRDKLILDLQQQLQAHVTPKEGVEIHAAVARGLPVLSGKAEPAAAG